MFVREATYSRIAQSIGLDATRTFPYKCFLLLCDDRFVNPWTRDMHMAEHLGSAEEAEGTCSCTTKNCDYIKQLQSSNLMSDEYYKQVHQLGLAKKLEQLQKANRPLGYEPSECHVTASEPWLLKKVAISILYPEDKDNSTTAEVVRELVARFEEHVAAGLAEQRL